jgi:RNA polymerase sigma-70 factor (ECF subfamily)
MSARALMGVAVAPAVAIGAAGRSSDRVRAVSDAETASFQAVRPLLLGIAQRVLGSGADAEDVVQDAWIRWQRTDRTRVRNAPTFLATTTTRLAINVTRSARARRDVGIDPWLPRLVDADADHTLGAERGDALALAVRAVLERLSPAERAAYVLREAFDYPYLRIAEVLALSEANARQLVTRARNHLSGEPCRRVGAAEHERLLNVFVAAAQTGDLAALEQLLAAAVASNPGGRRAACAERVPVAGRGRGTGVPVPAGAPAALSGGCGW